MGVLQAELSNSQGIPSNSITKSQSNICLAQGNYFDSLIFTKSYVLNSTGILVHSISKISYQQQYKQSDYVQYLTRFVRFFGEGVKQDASKLYINKSSLGLKGGNNNTAESILVALLLQVLKYESNSLISRVTVDVFKTEFITINGVPTVQTILVINLYSFVQTFEQFEILVTQVTPNSFN